MTTQVLITELSTIIQEVKKKNPELRTAAEKSLQEIKVLPSTSEAQITADLRRRPHIVTPLLIACHTGNVKVVLPAVTCIQRLVFAAAFPSERLKDLLDALLECCKIGLEVQLKILQSLPQLLQIYSEFFEGELQSSILQICTTLQQVKTGAVSGTASAILQQIISLLFEKVESEDDGDEQISVSAELTCDEQTVAVGAAAHDAYRVFQDLCLLTEGQKARFIPNAALSVTFGLELLEAVLTNHSELFHSHEELAYLLRIELMPLLTRLLSERLAFPVTVRTIRLFCILLREHLEAVRAECEVPLSLLNHSLDADASVPWRRALCMETYRMLYSTPNLVLELYSLFDAQPKKRNIIQENLGTFVRLASEKPTLIGLGSQSSFPAGSTKAVSNQEQIAQAALQAGAVTGLVGPEVNTEINTPGISSHWSSIRTPCMDQLDKNEPTALPETYNYSLILTCLSGLSEGLAKVILPLTVDNQQRQETRSDGPASLPTTPLQESIDTFAGDETKRTIATSAVINLPRRSKAVPPNPLTSTSHPALPVVNTIAQLIESCWPAILASSSTFLYAALDADFYRNLIRSFQRFTQVAGLLRLSTPRDAFLTTLAKAAVPPVSMKTEAAMTPLSSIMSPRTDSFLSSPFTDSSNHSRRTSLDVPGPTLSQRNLMCLRALINLAIALGAILEGSWRIVLENLQKADNILAQSGNISSAREYRSGGQNGDRNQAESSSTGSISSEIAAVEAAITRLFQSTSDYPNDAFLSMLVALCDLITDGRLTEPNAVSSNSPRRVPLLRTASIAGLAASGLPQPRNNQFAIAKLGEVARINILRLASSPEGSGWTELTEKLLAISTVPTFESVARLMAADVLSNIAVGVTVSTMSDSVDVREEVQFRSLTCLESQITKLYNNIEVEHENPSGTDVDVHRASIEALRAILEQCGDTLIAGWRIIFNIIETAFRSARAPAADSDSISYAGSVAERASFKPISTRIARSAFACVQLICSDFLESLKKARVIVLVDIMLRFFSQKTDLNISLTTLTLFWTLSDFLQDDLSSITFETVTDLEADLVTAAESGSFTAAWLLLQNRLASMTGDFRADARNGAIQTILRILDNSGEKLSPPIWQFCLRSVIFEMIDINIDACRSTFSVDAPGTEDEKSIIATAENVLQGVAIIMATHLNTISRTPQFEDIWLEFLKRCVSYIELTSVDITTHVFRALTRILAASEPSGPLSTTDINQAWELWSTSITSITSEDIIKHTSTEKALTTYVSTHRQLYRLIREQVSDAQTLRITENLSICVKVSAASAYLSDVDTPTQLQNEVLSCIDSLRQDLPNVPTYLITCLADFVTMPYTHSSDDSRKTATFTAFSKRSIKQLHAMLMNHRDNSEIYSSGAIAKGLVALVQSIRLKYRWQRQGKEPAMWRIASTAVVDLLKTIIPSLDRIEVDSEARIGIWSEAANIIAAIGEADQSMLPADDVLLTDEAFDMANLAELRPIMTKVRKDDGPVIGLWLGHEDIPEPIRLTYVSSLSRTSLLHDSDFISDGDPLDNIYEIRDGRTYDPSFTPRLQICYSCLDELFTLVAANDMPGSPSYASLSDTKLAETAFPFLILRCALPLRRYIADQPLRGLLPTPMSQRLELLYILKKCTELRCTVGWDVSSREALGQESWTVPVMNKSRRHLEWLLPLVNKASGLARNDKEIADAMQRVIDVAFRRKSMVYGGI